MMRGTCCAVILVATAYRIGCDCNGPSLGVGSTDAAVDAGPVDAGCLVSCPTNQICTSVGQCECSRPVSALGPSDGRATVIEVAGLPHVLFYENSFGGRFRYTECVAGCDTTSPTWTPPIILIPDGGDIDNYRHPALAYDGLTVAAGYPTAGVGLTFAECEGNCSSLASWSTVDLDPVAHPPPATSATVDVAVLQWDGGTYRALTTLTGTVRTQGSLEYLECSAPSCSNVANWSVLYQGPLQPSYGTSVLLHPEPGQLRRYFVVGSDTATSLMAYDDCAGPCQTTAAWPTPLAMAAGGILPSMAITSAGVPRIAYQDSNNQAVRYTWCTSAAPPCVTAAQWNDALVAPGDAILALRVGADDRARIAFSSQNAINLATETAPGSGTFSVAPVQDCVETLDGGSPSLWLGDADRYRIGFSNFSTANYTQQSP